MFRPRTTARLAAAAGIVALSTGAPLHVAAAADPAATSAPVAAELPRPHVLHLVVDDLRSSIGALGDPHAITPNLDRLLAEGTVFTHAYVQQAVCSASRASVLTGLRPTQTTVDYPYNEAFRTRITQENPTFPTWFEQAGAWSRMIGKVHHDSPKRIETLDAPPVSRLIPEHTYIDYAEPEHAALARDYIGHQKAKTRPNPVKLPAFESADVDDAGYVDGRNADLAQEFIRKYRKAADAAVAAGETPEPLFLSLGFLKPHLPFNAPQRYWDLYDPADLPDHVTEPNPDSPPFTRATYELASRYDTAEAARNLPLPDPLARDLTHGYYACVSYIDAQIGEVLATLEEAGLADNTIVGLWSDHGFHLGDNGMWGKHVNFEVATRAPLMFRGPGVPQGRKVELPVELLDVYPTLCDLAGLEPPAHLMGRSLVPLMEAAAPGGALDAEDAAAVSEFPRGKLHGWSVRTPTYRYTQWREDGGGVIFEELYDHRSDPRELNNLAAEEPTLTEQLAARLHAADPASAGGD